MSNNMYDIIGKMASLFSKEETPTTESTPVYESVEPNGDIMKAVKSLEEKFSIFKESRDEDDSQEYDKYWRSRDIDDPKHPAYYQDGENEDELAEEASEYHAHGFTSDEEKQKHAADVKAQHGVRTTWHSNKAGGSEALRYHGASEKVGYASNDLNSKGPMGEGAIDDLEDARLEKEANTEFDDDEFDYTKADKKSSVRKVSGSSYGGSKAKEEELDEGSTLRGLEQIADNEVYAVTPARGHASYHVHGVINSPEDHKKFKGWYGSEMSTKTGAELKRIGAGKLSHTTNVFDKFDEGAIDDLEDARLEKEANADSFDAENFKPLPPKSTSRKVSGSSYGGGKAKEEELDEDRTGISKKAALGMFWEAGYTNSELMKQANEMLSKLPQPGDGYYYADDVKKAISGTKELSETVDSAELDEVSNQTLGSYIKKAHADTGKRPTHAVEFYSNEGQLGDTIYVTAPVGYEALIMAAEKLDKYYGLEDNDRLGPRAEDADVDLDNGNEVVYDLGIHSYDGHITGNVITLDKPTRKPNDIKAKRTAGINTAANKIIATNKELSETVDSADAYRVLNDLDVDKDFFTLSPDQVHALLDYAKEVGYRKGKYAPGSTARMFHQQLRRQASKHKPMFEADDELTTNTGEIQEMSNKQKGLSFLETYKKLAEATEFGDKVENSKAELKPAKADGKTAGHKPMKQDVVKEAAELRDQPLYTEPEAWAQYAKEKAEQEMGGMDDEALGGLETFDAFPDTDHDELSSIAKLAGLPEPESEAVPVSDLAGSMDGGMDTLDDVEDDNLIDIVSDEPEMAIDEPEMEIAEGEAVSINGKTVNMNSLSFGDVHNWDAPDYSDAYIDYAEFEDGTPLSADEADELQDTYSGEVNMALHDSLHEAISEDDEDDDGDLGAGNDFSGALASAKAKGEKEFTVGGKTYTVKEDQTALNLMRKLSGLKELAEERDIEYVNTPREQVAPVSAAIPSGDDLNKSKKQDPETANKAANPLKKKDKKVDESLWNNYTGILKGVKK